MFKRLKTAINRKAFGTVDPCIDYLWKQDDLVNIMNQFCIAVTEAFHEVGIGQTTLDQLYDYVLEKKNAYMIGLRLQSHEDTIFCQHYLMISLVTTVKKHDDEITKGVFKKITVFICSTTSPKLARSFVDAISVLVPEKTLLDSASDAIRRVERLEEKERQTVPSKSFSPTPKHTAQTEVDASSVSELPDKLNKPKKTDHEATITAFFRNALLEVPTSLRRVKAEPNEKAQSIADQICDSLSMLLDLSPDDELLTRQIIKAINQTSSTKEKVRNNHHEDVNYCLSLLTTSLLIALSKYTQPEAKYVQNKTFAYIKDYVEIKELEALKIKLDKRFPSNLLKLK